MGISPPPPPEGVLDVAAWEHFWQLIARGVGVCDYPDRPEELVPSSGAFFLQEVDRVEHHRRNSIPFLIEHCGLAGRSVLEFGAGTGGMAVAMVRAGVRAVTAVEPVALNAEA